MDMETYESVLLVKSEVFIYKIPPATNNRGHRAANWNLTAACFVGRLRVVATGKNVILKVENPQTGCLFAECPVETYPGISIESVTDSSRYFVIRVVDSGRCAFLGMGFTDRSDAFDLNIALQDHFKWVKNQEKIEKDDTDPKPDLDLGFKEGETIKINMKIAKKDGSKSTYTAAKNRTSTGPGILPPPPGVIGKIAPPPGTGSSPLVSPAHHKPTVAQQPTEWSEFTSANNQEDQQQQQKQQTTNSNWVQF